jgi:asparagine synthase (glutamine-hydrolysing)
VHNTVTVDGQDQMKMVTRFTWTNWAKGRVLRHDEKNWQSEHDGYMRLPDPVSHKRTVSYLGEDRWLVVDDLNGNHHHHYALHWLLSDGEYEVRELAPLYQILIFPADSKPSDSKIFIQMGLISATGEFSVVRADPTSTRGWRSRYYGDKEPAISAMLGTHQPRVRFWTFFGRENDIVQVEGQIFTLLSPERTTSINLQTLRTTY